MTGTKRQPEDFTPEEEEGSAAKRRRVVEPPVAATGSDLNRVAVRPVDFDSLPNELQQKVLRNVLREVANRPNRLQARADLDGLLENNKRFNNLVDKTNDLSESKAALERHPGVESRYVAVCLDVVGGMSVPDAVRQNGPLPKKDETLHDRDVDEALKYATPEHLANLVEAFSARTGPASKEVLTGVARAVTSQGDDLAPALETASIHNLVTLTSAFTKNNLALEDSVFADVVEVVACEVAEHADELLPDANIQQIATLLGAFSRHDDYPSLHEDDNFDEAMEAVADEVLARRHHLLPQADVEQIATLAGALMSHPERYADHIEAFAWQVQERGDELLREASAEQLATLKAAFEGIDEPDCQSALAKVVEATARPDAATSRPQLEKRDRSDRSR